MIDANSTVGTAAIVNSTHLGHHSFSAGAIVTVVAFPPGYESYEGRYLRVENETGMAQWLQPDSLDPLDPSQITDLDLFKRVVVREALAAAKVHGWCSVAQDTLRQMGLGEYLPVTEVVRVSFDVAVERQPGQSDRDVQRAGRALVTLSEEASRVAYRHGEEILPR